MVASRITGIAPRGIVACLPGHREGISELAGRFGDEAASRIARATGIETRHLAGTDICTSDLGLAAARRLLDGLGWQASSVDLLIMVTQTPDHFLPASSYRLHHALGLPKRALALDLTLGCSGFVNGLWTASSLLQSAGGKRALLVVGDTTSRLIDPLDRNVAPLFGDAAAAIALEVEEGAPPMVFDLGSDGAGAPYLAVAGGALRAMNEEPRLFMDGTQVFAFTLREVPTSLRAVLDAAGWSVDDLDHLVLHQANAQMMRHLAQKLGVPVDKTLVALGKRGNTSSASIPLAMVDGLAAALLQGPVRLLLSGFGVGWSWGSAALVMGPLAVCESLIFHQGQD